MSEAPMDLAAALSPCAVTIVGASSRSVHTRYLIDNLTRRESCRFAGPIHLVNRSGATIDGIASLASTADLDAPPGLVMMLIPTPDCLSALEAFRHLPDGVVVYSGGAEAGNAGAQDALREWALERGVPLFGPQSIGVGAIAARAFSLVAPMRAEPRVGEIALVFQSAGLLGGTVNSFFQRELGLHTAISIGNAVVLPFTTVATHLLRDEGVRALGGYVDGVATSEELVDVARLAQELAKPFVLLVGGSSEAGRSAVRSHTGALATSRRVVEGIAAQFGVILVNDADELVWSLEAFATSGFRPAPRGGVGVFASSGGAGITMADIVSSAGVPLPTPAAATRAELSRERPMTTFNPFDAGAASLDDPEKMRRTLETFARDPGFGIVVSAMAAGLPAREGMEGHLRQANTFVEAITAAGKLPLLATPVVSSQGQNSRPVASWPGVTVAAGAKEAAAKLRALWLWANGPERDADRPTSAPVEHEAPAGTAAITSGPAARSLLDRLDARWPDEVVVRPRDDARDALGRLRFPVVAKAEVGLAHRLASGGLLRGIASVEAALAAVEFLRARFGGDVALVEEIDHRSEYVIGFERDERYGPLVMFGRGGSDVGGEIEFRRLPLSPRAARSLVAAHVADAGEIEPLVRALLSLEPIVIGRGWIASLDLNPVIVRDGAVVVLDAKIHARS